MKPDEELTLEELSLRVRDRINAVIAPFTDSHDRDRVLAWIEAALDSPDDLTRGMVALVIEGAADIVALGPDGTPRLRCTEQGAQDALQILHESPEARELYARLMPRHAIVDPPKTPQ